MSLDKQQILNELGSVMNRLQSADCGCMGKLFRGPNPCTSNTGGAPPSCTGYRHGCCHGRGNNYCAAPNAGELHPSMGTSQHMNHRCMGHCNPPKLYGDTYNYLNENLMQPVVKEVYNDLKTITPQNTVMNSQMGSANNIQGPNGMQNIPGIDPRNTLNPIPQHNNPNPQQSAFMHGMGPNIVNMMTGATKPNSNDVAGQGNQVMQPMVIDAPQSPHGKVGIAPIANPTNTYQRSLDHNIGDQTNIKSNAIHNQTISPNQHSYGQHSHGIKKFNEMFPGVMNNIGGDLGFDPMAIAVQMNPANQQQAAMNVMHKVMNGNESAINNIMKKPNVTQPVVGSVNRANTYMPQSSTVQPSQNLIQGETNNITNSNLSNNPLSVNQQMPMEANQQYVYNFQQKAGSENRVAQPYQQMNATLPIINQESFQQQQLQEQIPHQTQGQGQLENYVPSNLNSGAVIAPPNDPRKYEEIANTPTSNAQQLLKQVAPEASVIKEPIFPANISKNRYSYNTLGQPVQMLPAQMYHTKDPGGPQTLSPQNIPTRTRNDPLKYSNVKATESKTSIMGNQFVRKNSSKNQLQHLYNQYKGSQSFTQQNIPGHTQGGTASEGRLKITQEETAARQVPVEKFGGDTVNNNIVKNDEVKKASQVAEHTGDISESNKPQSNVITAKQVTPDNQRKLRNGLQDIVYTSKPISTAWTFHGR